MVRSSVIEESEQPEPEPQTHGQWIGFRRPCTGQQRGHSHPTPNSFRDGPCQLSAAGLSCNTSKPKTTNNTIKYTTDWQPQSNLSIVLIFTPSSTELDVFGLASRRIKDGEGPVVSGGWL